MQQGVRMCEWQRACVNDSECMRMRLIIITFYKNMFTSAASENGAIWMNSLLFPPLRLVHIRE